MLKRPHLLMIGGWADLFHKATNLGFDISYIGPGETTNGFLSNVLKKCKFVYVANIEQIGICLMLANKIHNKLPITAILSFTELGIETAAILRAILQIDGLDIWPVLRTRYKNFMREILVNIPNLAIPWEQLNSIQDLKKFYRLNGQKIIIKPISGAGSVGVTQIKSIGELETFYKKLDPLSISNYIVEKLIDSDLLYSVDSVSINGVHYFLSLSLTKIIGYPYSLGIYTVVPAYNIEITKRDRIVKCVRRFLNAMELLNGAAHTEVKIDNDGIPYIIESQTRVGGDRIWKMIELTTGYSQIDITLANLIKPTTPKNFPKAKIACGFFCLLPPPGKVKKISDLSFLKIDKYVLEYSINIKPNQIIYPIKDNTERYGYIFLHSSNHEALFEKINCISQQLYIEYTDGSLWRPFFKAIA